MTGEAPSPAGLRQGREALLFGVCALAAGALALHGPIADDLHYHLFADQRTLVGIPAFWNVASNLAFLFAAVYGLRRLRQGPRDGERAVLRPALAVLCAALALIAVGSTGYHLAPDDASLSWDRLPMAVAFAAFFALVLGERIEARLARAWLAPLVAGAIASILYWRWSGDLRAYALVQFLPLLLTPLIVLLYPSQRPGVRLIWGVLGLYLLAKAFEMLDAHLLEALGLSGHTLEHFAAALAAGLAMRLFSSADARRG